MRRWPAPPTSLCRSIRSTRRIPSSCARSSWWPKQWRRRWAGCQVRWPAGGGGEAAGGRMTDVIDTLAAIARGSPLDAVRNMRPQARLQAQASQDSLFEPVSEADASKQERFAIACFVAGLHNQPEIAAFYE